MGCSTSKEATTVAAKPEAPPVVTPDVTPAVSEPKEVNFKPIHSAVRWNKPLEDIEKLLTSSAAANCVDPNNGNCPIHIAAQNGHFEILQLLINKGAETNVKNAKGNTPIHMAVGYDYYECAMLLIESKGDVTIKNEAGHASDTGIDGDKCLGLAALASAKTSDDVNHAFDLCEQNLAIVNKANFIQAGMKVKKSLGSEWSTVLQDRFKTITTNINQTLQNEKNGFYIAN